MTDRYQLAALSGAVPLFVAALAPVALVAEDASDRLARLTASVAATPDPLDQVAVIVGGIRDIGASGASSFADWIAVATVIAAIPAPTLSPALTRAQDLALAASRLVVAACWQEAAVAAVTDPPAFRDDVETMRATLVSGIESVLDGLAVMGAIDAHAAVAQTVDLAIAGLDDLALTVAPLAQVRTGRSLPAPVLAWTLYGDVERCEDLVARAATLTPLFMPTDLTVPAPMAI
jgi:prophage DNA circulation protein